MKKYALVNLAVLLASFILSCGANHEAELDAVTQEYWKAVFGGNMDKAYSLLSKDSRQAANIDNFTAAMSFGLPLGEFAEELRREFSARAKLTIIGIEERKKEATVNVILLVPATGPLLETLEARLASGDVSVADPGTWMSEQLIAALRGNTLPTQELRVKMKWKLEDKQWRLVFG